MVPVVPLLFFFLLPDGALSELLDGLRGEGLITAGGFHDREAVRKHGGRAISGVRTDLLC